MLCHCTILAAVLLRMGQAILKDFRSVGIQYFNAVRMEGRISRTLAAMNDEPFFSAAFTVSNISLIMASTLLFIRRAREVI